MTTDLTGNKYERLLVLKPAGKGRHGLEWECLCDCGKTVVVPGVYLRRGTKRSCNCLHDENLEKLHQSRPKHGHCIGSSKNKSVVTKEYKAWTHMKQRCFNPKEKTYPRYGGRGITMEPRWVSDFEAFLQDIGLAPQGARYLVRLDKDGDYVPGNVKWARERWEYE